MIKILKDTTYLYFYKILWHLNLFHDIEWYGVLESSSEYPKPSPFWLFSRKS